MNRIVSLLMVVSWYSISFSQGYLLDSISEIGGYTYISRPIGTGPFPGILYSHGGLGGNIGGDLRGTSIALAQAGYICWAQLRTDTIPITPHITQVEASLDSLLVVEGLNANKVGIIGFSRGGLLTLMTAISRFNDVHAVVAMAPAAANNTLANTLTQVASIDDSVLLMVAQNDTFQDDHVQLIIDIENAMNNVVNYRSISYDPFDSDLNGIVNSLDDGHELFWKVQQPYWSDLIFFLDNNLKTITSINNILKWGKLMIYPNPFKERAVISISNQSLIKAIAIYQINGTLVKQIPNLNKKQVVVSRETLSSGIYLIKIVDQQNQCYWEKIVVN